MQIRSVTLVLAFVCGAFSLGCGNDSSAKNASDGGVQPDADIAETYPLVESGTRLRAIMHGPAGGPKTFLHWRDTETGICQWTPDQLFADHYCLPTRRVDVYFSDAACTQTGYVTFDSPRAVGEYVRDTAYYVDETTNYLVGAVSALPEALYIKEREGCSTVAASQIPEGATGLQSITAVPLTDFVKGSFQVEHRDDDMLASHVLRGEDGSRLGQDAYDLANTTGCMRRSDDPGDLCLPVSWHAYFFDFAEAGRFSDDACTVPVYYSPPFGEAILNTLRYGITASRDALTEEPAYRVHKLGSEITSGSMYQGQSSCIPYDTAGPGSQLIYYEFGDEVTLSTVGSITDGSGPIRTLTDANRAGQALVATGTFVDTAADNARLVPYPFPDAVTRFVPTGGMASISPQQRLYEDSACSIPVANGAGTETPRYAIAWDDDPTIQGIESVYAVVGPHLGDAYSFADDSAPCAIGSQSHPYFKVGAPVDDAAWAPVEQEVLPAP